MTIRDQMFVVLPGWEPAEPWTGLDPRPDYWPDLRKVVLDRDQGLCGYCGRSDRRMHVDHIIPRSLGGRDTLGNLIAACPSCNCKKGAKVDDALREVVALREQAHSDREAAIAWGWVERCAFTEEPLPTWVAELLEVEFGGGHHTVDCPRRAA